jgi:hypothetical protein
MKFTNILKGLTLLLFFYQPNIFSQNNVYTIAELVSNSKCIVLGKVTKVTPWVGADGRIHSDVKFQISKVYKGNLKQKRELNFSLLGGTLGGRRTTVLEYPHFTENVESILFLLEINKDYDATNAL